jgi:hypothetical protein
MSIGFSIKQKLKSLRKYDMFGHLITLNFNKRGDKHKTMFGAFFSIIIKFFIYLYVALTLQTMFTKSVNVNSTISSSQKIDTFGEVDYKDTGLFIYFEINH